MLKQRVVAGVLSAIVAVGMFGCSKQENRPAGETRSDTAGKKLTLAVIPKGTQHVFWKSVEAGAKRAEAELGVQVIWKGPLQENDRAQQIQLVQQFISDGVDGIALAPLDSRALVGPVQKAHDANIPVVIFDSPLEAEGGKDYVTLVATDNRAGGRRAGEALVKLLGEKGGNVVIMRYQVGSASTEQREAGFLEVIKQHPNVKIIADRYSSGPSAGESKDTAINLADQLKQAQAVFTPNESTTQGMLLAIRQLGVSGKVKFVGFDASPVLVEALKAGDIDALVVQNPKKMGYEAVKSLVAAIQHKPVDPRIDTGSELITKANLEDPQIQALLK